MYLPVYFSSDSKQLKIYQNEHDKTPLSFMDLNTLNQNQQDIQITRENDHSPFCIPLTTVDGQTVTVCDTSSDRLQLWLKNQFSLKDCDKEKKVESEQKKSTVTEKEDKPKKSLNQKEVDETLNLEKLMKDIMKFGEKPKEKESAEIKSGIMSMLNNSIQKEEEMAGADINSQQSQALRLIEQRKKVEKLFEDREATQESSLENMIKSAMQNKMNQKVMKLANEIAREKKEASERIAEEKKEILSSINRRMEKEKQLVAGMALEESKLED